MAQTPQDPTTPQSNKTRIIVLSLIVLMIAAFLFGAGSLLSAGLFLMKGVTPMAGSELIRALLFFAVAYLINVLTAFAFSKRWSWRGLQFVFEKPSKVTSKTSKK
ncbi:MAG: hypothetical protein ACREGE_02160 [Candidatus Microsaccharimonas sp.]